MASGHASASAAAIEVLRAGGNAVDAAVASMFTSFHAEPLLTSAGGAGFAVALIDGVPLAVDFFAAAPGLGTGRVGPYRPPPGAFQGIEVDFGSAKQVFHVGPGSIAVPGNVPGLLALQSRAGRLPVGAVLDPAARACAEGTEISAMGAVATDLLWPIVASTEAQRATFLGPDGRRLGAGDRYHNPELGRFIEAVRRLGPRALSEGPLAAALVEEVGRGGGGLTAEDLAAYEVRFTEPVHARTGQAELLLVPPASVGGLWLAYAARLLDELPVPEAGAVEEVLLLRAVFTVTNLARVEICGDETPTPEHVDRMLDPAFVERGRAEVRRLLGHGPLPPAPMNALGGTTHVSVIDRWGNACAITTSNGECSGLVLPEHGVFLNNFLGEEDLNPLGFHRFRPGARMASAMCPMLARRGDGAVIALGSGGSARIRTALLQVLRHLLTRGASPEAAVRADRLHVEPGKLYAESASTLAEAVRALPAGLDLGVFPQRSMFFGGTHLALRHADGTCVGVGDDRRGGVARTVA